MSCQGFWSGAEGLRQRYNLKIQRVKKDIEEQKDLQERYQRKLKQLQEDFEEDLQREVAKAEREHQAKLEELQTEHQRRTAKAQASARNRETRLAEQIEETKTHYQQLLKQEKARLEQDYARKTAALEKPETPPNELELAAELDKITQKFTLKKREALLQIDREFEDKLKDQKRTIELEQKPQENPHVAELERQVRRAKDEVNDLRMKIDRIEQEIAAGRRSYATAHAPDRIEQLEEQVRELKRMAPSEK